MLVLKGVGVSDGIACAPLRDLSGECPPPAAGEADPAQELAAFERALAVASGQIDELVGRAGREMGEDAAEILSLQQLLISSPDVVDRTRELIAGGSGAVEAVLKVGRDQCREFQSLPDPYMQVRGQDVVDVTRRIANIIRGHGPLRLDAPAILCADDLMLSDLLEGGREMLRGIVLRRGTALSHLCLLVRAMGLPMVVKAELPRGGLDGRTAILDGGEGVCVIDPDARRMADFERERSRLQGEQDELRSLVGTRSVTRAGREIRVEANVSVVEDIELALSRGADGVGLFRSEFLYLGRDAPPSEEEQFSCYRKVAVLMDDRPVTIRTFDLGGDKRPEFQGIEPPDTSMLGIRGLRYALRHPDLLRAQLRALLRAAVFGNLSVMLPMVTSLAEIAEVRALIERCRVELEAAGVECRVPRLGVTVETPACALEAAAFAREVDFLSVGTNDLTQYTLAINRQHPGLSYLYDPHHPAVLGLLGQVAAAARGAGIECSICGELAADPALTDTFIEQGFTALSVAPSEILRLRRRVVDSCSGGPRDA
ncbi:MAG: phosphoenolpyruvate--protein phosphotransferase [Succinivibrionaceae bacterium]|nr:phosphoenolpyruvate--protein phosphotransferase [Succinivibrionaceae bacterium]